MKKENIIEEIKELEMELAEAGKKYQELKSKNEDLERQEQLQEIIRGCEEAIQEIIDAEEARKKASFLYREAQETIEYAQKLVKELAKIGAAEELQSKRIDSELENSLYRLEKAEDLWNA